MNLLWRVWTRESKLELVNAHRYTFLSNHNVHKSSFGLFLGYRPFNGYILLKDLWIRGWSEAQKQRPHELLEYLMKNCIYRYTSDQHVSGHSIEGTSICHLINHLGLLPVTKLAHQLATTFISTFDGNRGTVTSRTTPTSITAQFYHDDCLKRAQWRLPFHFLLTYYTILLHMY